MRPRVEETRDFKFAARIRFTKQPTVITVNSYIYFVLKLLRVFIAFKGQLLFKTFQVLIHICLVSS